MCPAMAMLSHRKPWSAALVLVAISCVCVASSTNDTPVASYRTSTSEVRIVFFATDQDNHVVETIDKDDFAVVDGGMVIREFRSLEPAKETALHVVVLVDASGSVTPRFRASMENALRVVSQEPSTSTDDFSVLSFSGLRSNLICAGTVEHRRRNRSFSPYSLKEQRRCTIPWLTRPI